MLVHCPVDCARRKTLEALCLSCVLDVIYAYSSSARPGQPLEPVILRARPCGNHLKQPCGAPGTIGYCPGQALGLLKSTWRESLLRSMRTVALLQPILSLRIERLYAL